MTTLTSTTPQMSIYTDPQKTTPTYQNTNIIGSTVGVTATLTQVTQVWEIKERMLDPPM